MTRQEFMAAIAANNLEKYTPRFEALLRDSIHYQLTRMQGYPETVSELSRIGGLPDFPVAKEWPRDNNGKPLAFIAQLDLSELKPFDHANVLPDSGLLYLFYAADMDMGGYSPDERHMFSVIYFNGPLEETDMPDYPEDLTEEARYWPCRLTMSNAISMPDKWGKHMKFMSKEERDVYSDNVWQGGIINKSLGNADNLQDDMEPVCEIVNLPEFDGKFARYDSEELDAVARENWTLLLQVDSNEEDAYMNWNDAGRLYFWIRNDDLAKGNFDNCWCVHQD